MGLFDLGIHIKPPLCRLIVIRTKVGSETPAIGTLTGHTFNGPMPKLGLLVIDFSPPRSKEIVESTAHVFCIHMQRKKRSYKKQLCRA